MALARKTLATLERKLHAHAGLELPSWIVESRAEARMQKLGIGESAYAALLTSPRGEAELAALIEAVRVGETRFFRHQPQVTALLEVVVPALRDAGVKAPRVWSAGCASGEEPYTLALVLRKALPPPLYAPTIHATDVSREAIEAARRGAYAREVREQIPDAYREGLVEHERGVSVRPEIASLVTFERQNLAEAFPARTFHVVWCRNVLIYFGPEAKQKVLARLVDALEPGGFLFLGYSETLRDVPGLSAVRFEDQVLWRRSPSDARVASDPARRARSSPDLTVAVPRAPRSAGSSPDLTAQLGSAPKRSARPEPPDERAAPARAEKGPSATLTMHIGGIAPDEVAQRFADALAKPGVGAVRVDLDSAEYVDDAVAAVLHRALASARSAGIAIELRASRPGAQRWLRRHRLPGGEP